MARDDSDEFRIRPGRSRDRGTKVRKPAQSFVTRVQIAVRQAGGDPGRSGSVSGSAERTGKANGRFNGRGRGAGVVASLPRHGGEWRRDGAGRFRSRRVVVKARVVKLKIQRGARHVTRLSVASKAVDAHLRYIARDGVTREGEKGRVYSALEDQADGQDFVERGRGDRHQFRFIVAPEDSTEMTDLRGFTRALMRQVQIDLATRLDWIAVDHHNTGHPHTHILVRGVTDDGKILNIAGDYIAHGIRVRASELVTRELGHQSEIEIQTKLQSEVNAERLTRLDQALLAEQRDQGAVDLRPGEGASYLIGENRTLTAGRVKRLERYGLATEAEPGRWVLAGSTTATLRQLGERTDVIKTMHQALGDHGLAEARGVGQYVIHGSLMDHSVVGRVLAKGLAGDEMGERIYLVIDGVDGRVHHLEFADPSGIEEVGRGMIVEAVPPVPGPGSADRKIAVNANEEGGVYRPSQHLARIKDSFEQQHKDPEAFVRFHVRRLEALRGAGHVERIDDDHWRVPNDLVAQGQAYDLSQGANRPQLRVLSTFDLERQIASDGATWLDRQLTARAPIPVTDSGFGRQVSEALARRAQRLVGMGHATAMDGRISVPQRALAALERQEIARVGGAMASSRGRTFQPVQPGEYVSGTLVGSAHLASGRFAMLETVSGEGWLGFTLVPWQPVLHNRIGLHIAGVVRDAGSIDWSFGRKRGLGL
jgi:type IV secretory pathway VirD2 relaxase